jgi:mono/diheme cytochrome c family protein
MTRNTTLCTLMLFAAAGAAAAAPAGGGKFPRGKYLVENVGLCGDCHTPRDPRGQFEMSRWLLGAPVEFRPVHPMPWGAEAPRLAGLPEGWTEADMARFLSTGIRPNGSPARPPMPPYRFSPEDAAAVTAYLKSLKPAGK